MKLLQMRYLCELSRRRYNFSEAARALHTSQPGISRQIQMLEAELGFEILSRNGKRIAGLTRQGEAVLAVARRMESEAAGLQRLSEDHHSRLSGRLTVATTHFHARYTLLEPVLKFRKTHPDVSLTLHQSEPADIAQRVASDEADIGITVDALPSGQDLAFVPWQAVERALITPVGHPLLKVKKLTLELIAKYPMIMYDPRLSGGRRVKRVFTQKNLTPDIVLTAIDADVVKAYVAAGLGVAVVQKPVYDPKRDRELRSMEVSHLFQPVNAVIILRRRGYLGGLVDDFIRTIAPNLPPQVVQRALAAPAR